MNKKKVVDLTMLLKNGMTTFPVSWHPKVKISKLGRLEIEKRETRKLVIGTHTGTHCDAPRHFIKNGKTIDKFNPEIFIGKALVIDLSYKKRFEEVKKSEIEKQIKGKKINRLILNFNWCRKINSSKYYSDHPYLSNEAAQLIVDKGCKLLGMDTPMPDNPKNGHGCTLDSPIHKILLKNNCIIVEYLCNVYKIKKKIIDLIVAPLNIKDGDGAPSRVLGIY